MSFLLLLVVLVICGVIVYYVDGWPIHQWFKWAIKIVCVVVAVYYLLAAFGLIAVLSDIRVPSVR